MRKSLKISLNKVFISLFIIFYTFVPSVTAVGTVLEDYALDESPPVDTSEDILDEGISDPEWIAKPELLEEDVEEDVVLEEYVDGVYSVSLVEEREYVYPGNEDVRVNFTRVTEDGDLNISRVVLTEEEKVELNTSDDYGWSITSSMSNGSFTYDLTLPNSLNSDDVEVKYSEDRDTYNSIDSVVVNEDVIHIYGLDHFTIFVVVSPIPDSQTEGSICTVAEIEGICYETIQAAIDAANSGDIIRVSDGTYDPIIINKSLTIINNSFPIIDCGGSGNGILIQAPNVTIDGFEITNCSVGIRSYGGPSDYENLTIRNTEIHNNNQNGITLLYDNFDKVTLENLEIHNNGQNGIGLSDGIDIDELILTDLNIFNNGHHGIYIASTGTNINEINAKNLDILDNNHSAITIDSGSLVSNASFSHSKFEGSDTNIAVRGTTTHVDGLIITDSSISYSPTNHGFWLRDGIVENLEFDNVSIIDNRHQGFHVTNNASLRDSVIKNGVIKDNAWGLLTRASTITNLTIDNVDFLDNFAGSGLSVASGTVNGLNILNSTFENNAWEHLDIGIGWIGALTASNITVLLNTFKTGTGTSIWIADNATFGEDDISINENNFVSSVFAINNNTLTDIDATHNWWGDHTGPSGTGPGLGGAISNNVDHVEWLCEAYFTNRYSIGGFCDMYHPQMDNIRMYVNDVESTLTKPGDTVRITAEVIDDSDIEKVEIWVREFPWDPNNNQLTYGFMHYVENSTYEFEFVVPSTYQNGDSLNEEVEGNYFNFRPWDIHGNSHIGWRNNFTIDATAPSIPELLFPSDNQALRSSELYIEWGESIDNHTSSENITYEYRIYYRDPVLFPNNYWVFPYIGTTRHPVSGFASGTGEGTYWYTVQAVDEIGNESGFASPRKFYVDNTRPEIEILSPADNTVHSGTFDIQVKGTDELSGLGQFVVNIQYEESHIAPCVNENAQGAMEHIVTCTIDTTSFSQGDGNYSIRTNVRDRAGNLSQTLSRDFIFDNTAPQGTIDHLYYESTDTYLDYFITNDNTPVLGGTCSDNIGIDTVTIEINGQVQTVICVNNEEWRSERFNELADGIYTATLTLTDLAGNQTVETQSIQIDTVAPTAVHTYFDGEEIATDTTYVQHVNQLSFLAEYYDDGSGIYQDSYVIFDSNVEGTRRTSNAYCSWRRPGNTLLITDNPLIEKVLFTNCVNELADGAYFIYHQIYDNATRKDIPTINQFRDVKGLHFVVDTVAPETTMDDISDEYYNTPITLEGTTVDENNVDYVELYYSVAGEDTWILIDTGDGLINTSNSNSFVWDFDWTPPTEGVYDISARGVDLAGNVENTSIVTNVTFDTTDPEITSLSVDNDYLEKYVNGIIGFYIFADVHDTLSGIDPESCEYTLDGINWLEGTYYSNSNSKRCQFNVPSTDLLNNQVLGIQVKVMDLAGNSRTSGVLNRTVDAEYPTSNVTLEHEYYGPNRLPIITGTASDTVSGVQYVNITIQRDSDDKYWDNNLGLWVDNKAMLATEGTETWTYNELVTALHNGVLYTVTPYATDNVNNQAQGTSESFTWDSQPPTDPSDISSPSHNLDQPTSNDQIVMNFSGAHDHDLSGVQGYYYSFSNTPETPSVSVENFIPHKNGLHTIFSTSLEDGYWYFNIRTIDKVGNITSTVNYGPMIVDTTPAEIEWVEPENNSIHSEAVLLSVETNEEMNNVRFLWRLQGEEGWNIDNSFNDNTKSDSYKYLFDPTEDGVYELRVQGRDLALNWSTADTYLTVTIDRTQPELTITYPLDDDHISGQFTFEGDAEDATSGIQDIRVVFRDHANDDAYVKTCWATYDETTDTFYLEVNDGTCDIPDGYYLIRVRVRDNAGNRRFRAVRRITVDNTAPESTITSPTENYFTNSSVNILGETEDIFSVDNVVLSFATYNDNTDECEGDWDYITTLDNEDGDLPYQWSYPWEPENEGMYCIRAQATDLAGNQEETSIIKNIVYDITIPTISLADLVDGILREIKADGGLSGIKTIDIRIGDTGQWIPYSPDMNLNTLVGNQPGTYTLYIRVADNAGNTIIQSTTFTIPAPIPAAAETVLGAITAPFTPQPTQALGVGGPLDTQEEDIEEKEEEDTDDIDVEDGEDDDTEVLGEDDEDIDEEEDEGGWRWWVYVLLSLPIFIIFFILWKRRKEEEEDNQY